jgi:hypothetical protein
MKKTILVIALLALVSMMIAPASALFNETLMTYAGTLEIGDAFPYQGMDVICPAYGLTNYYGLDWSSVYVMNGSMPFPFPDGDELWSFWAGFLDTHQYIA